MEDRSPHRCQVPKDHTCRQNQRQLGPGTPPTVRTKPGSAGSTVSWPRAGRRLRRGHPEKEEEAGGQACEGAPARN